MGVLVGSAWSGHDCSFCFLDEEGVPVVHAELERYIREKEPYGDGIAFFKERFPDEFSQLKYFGTCFPTNKTTDHEESFKDLTSVLEKNDGKLFVVSHHQAHAANTTNEDPKADNGRQW